MCCTQAISQTCKPLLVVAVDFEPCSASVMSNSVWRAMTDQQLAPYMPQKDNERHIQTLKGREETSTECDGITVMNSYMVVGS